jgi:hypothetical protein
MKSKVKSILIIFFDIKGIVLKENSFWQSSQLITHITVTFYGDCVRMCEDFRQNFDDERTGYCITTMHRLTLTSPPSNFCRKQNNYRPPPTLHFSGSPIEDKIERLPF